MLFSNIVSIIAWAEKNSNNDETIEENDYVKFDVTWNNNENEISMNDVKGGPCITKIRYISKGSN